MLKIHDSLAVITGGGIGCAIARHWVHSGGKGVLSDVAEEASL